MLNSLIYLVWRKCKTGISISERLLLCVFRLFVFSPKSHSLAVPLRGGETFDEEMSQVVFGDGSSSLHSL